MYNTAHMLYVQLFSTALVQQIMNCISYDSSVTQNVLSLPTDKVQPLVCSVVGFTLSRAAEGVIPVRQYGFSFLLA
jgi:hypothetical protein